MRYPRIIVAILAALSMTACFVDDTVHPIAPGERSDVINVIGRITRFADCDVSTRGVKDADEAKISNMAMAIFPCDDNGITGKCLYYAFEPNEAELLFTVNRAELQPIEDARYAMYIFTNVNFELEGISKSSTLDDMIEVATNVSNLRVPDGGFPMIGSLGDTFSTKINPDGKEFVLAPSDSRDDLPTVDGLEQQLLTIHMKALYAKINFTIEVDPDQTIAGNYTPQFNATNFAVKNVPSEVDFDISTNEVEVLDDIFTVSAKGNTVASGANTISYTFYLPERRLTPYYNFETCNDFPFEKGTYSKQIDDDQNGYRDEDEKYFQRFKGKLLGENQEATHVVISGRYRDHQNHYWDVDYTIYLGEDNSQNFDINRNYEYNNYVTIRGIQSTSDMSDKEGAISIDHRVNVKRSQPGIISLRREVLLDSHFEVRPLRIRANDGITDSDITHVKVEVDNSSATNWMRLERSFGDGTHENSPQTTVNGQSTSIYIDSDPNSASYGKRKFFTFDLVTGGGGDTGDVAPLNNSTSVILPLTDATECCWIYVDECTEVGDGVRAGKIKVSYGSTDYDGEFIANNKVDEQGNALYPSVDYIIHQRLLFPVQYATRQYHIEYEEEYLHNFDADNEYGTTETEGMVWGLPNAQLSSTINAIMTSRGSWGSVDRAVYQALLSYSPKYDFYLSRDIEESDWTWTSDHTYDGMVNDYNGYNFCKDIIQVVNGYGEIETDPSNDINVLQLDQKPKSAIEYCYNKNKRNRNGQVAWTGNTNNLKWYLPAIDEIEEIVMSQYGNGQYSYARFIDFQNKFYWSCQPAYLNNYVFVNRLLGDRHGQYMIDDTYRARATSVYYEDISGKGPSDPSNYNQISSGSTGYTKYIDADYSDLGGRLSNTGQKDVVGTERFSGSNNSESWNHALSKSAPQPGNLHRTNDMARVRCVRK